MVSYQSPPILANSHMIDLALLIQNYEACDWSIRNKSGVTVVYDISIAHYGFYMISRPDTCGTTAQVVRVPVRSSEHQSSGYQSFSLLVPWRLAGLSTFGHQVPWRLARLSPFILQEACGLAGLSTVCPPGALGTGGTHQSFQPPRYPIDWWNSSHFSPPGTCPRK